MNTLERVTGVTKDSKGKIETIHTNSSRLVPYDKALLMIKAGSLKGLRIGKSPYTGVESLEIVDLDITVNQLQ